LKLNLIIEIMKSLEKGFAIAVVAMFGFSTTMFAQVPQTGTEGTYPQEQHQTLPEDQQEQWNTQDDQSTFPQEQYQLGDADYSEVNENDLPEAVSSSIEDLYPEHDVKKAFRGTDNSYKVKLENGDDKSVVYFDSSGQFIKSEVATDKDRKDKKHKDHDNSSDW
jgi:hypothetical protein